VRHLYLHVPFCVRRCSYCDFSIAVRKRVPAAEYVECVLRELDLRARAGGSEEAGDSPLETIYLGGGTPSLLAPDAIAALVGGVFARAGASPSEAVEVTLEANPEDVTPEAARVWRRAGVNRVSLGAQSFDDRVLRWMHRSHGAARIGEAVGVLRDEGTGNLSLDLIFALPAHLQRAWDRDLDQAIALAPAHLSLYGLTVEPRTPLARWISRGATSAPDDERYAAEYLAAHERLGGAGYSFYEVSNAAQGERRSRHNAAYWSGRSYLGVGPAAHSYDGYRRRWNLGGWEAYRRALSAGRAPTEGEELLSEEQRELEARYLAFRTIEGVAASLCPPGPLSAWMRAGWVERSGDRVRCTPEGWLRLDALVRDLTVRPATV
jgi:oxygen-independent coproporphyrinogen-3 oxidase